MEPIFHLLIPVLFLIAFFPKIKKKLILALAIFAVLPDFDIFIPTMHRIIFHNIFFAVGIALIIFFVFGKLPGLISLFLLSAHLIMDFVYYGIALFWPLYNKVIGFDIEIARNLLTGKWNFVFNLKLGILSKAAEATHHHYLTTFGALIFSVFVLLLIIKYISLRKVHSPSKSTKEKVE